MLNFLFLFLLINGKLKRAKKKRLIPFGGCCCLSKERSPTTPPANGSVGSPSAAPHMGLTAQSGFLIGLDSRGACRRVIRQGKARQELLPFLIKFNKFPLSFAFSDEFSIIMKPEKIIRANKAKYLERNLSGRKAKSHHIVSSILNSDLF